MKSIKLSNNTSFPATTIPLPSSKSESNRALIINALSGNISKLKNLAEARDTQTMIRLLDKNPPIYDVLDAGTTMRFLTAYATVTDQNKVMTGTVRMCERPIGILVDALRTIGADIHYMNAEGYPPLAVHGMKEQIASKLKIRGDVSSQYISALLMIAPILPLGLELSLEGKVGSKTYIQMTLDLMANFGINFSWDENVIKVAPQDYKPCTYQIESDWSGASYWFSLLACAESGELFLKGLKKDSLQGDSAIVDIMDKLGVASVFEKGGVRLTKKEVSGLTAWDFTHCPDLAQTVAVTCAILGQKTDFTGLESLRIKETDRIAALQNELAKLKAKLVEESAGTFTLIPSIEMPLQVTIDTYDDHRMAMAFMPLLTKTDVVIMDPDVVDKSYPSFWKHVELISKKFFVQHEN